MTPVTKSTHATLASSPASQGLGSPGELLAKYTDSSGRLNTASVSNDIASVFSQNPDQAKKLYADVKSELEENGHPMDVRYLEEDVRSALGEDFFSYSQKGTKEGAVGEQGNAGDGFGADDALSLGLDVLPVVGTAKGLVELAIGRDPITGDEIPRWESVLGLAASVIPGGKAAAKGVGIASDVTKAVGKHGDELVQSAGKGVRSGADDVVGGVGSSSKKSDAISSVDAQRIAKLDAEGHAPIRHGGPNRVTDLQLEDRAMKGVDPASGTTLDAFNKFPDGSPKPHKVGKNATAFTSDKALLQADEFARNSTRFQENIAAAKANGDLFVDPVEIPLKDVFGSNYQDSVRGVTRLGSKNNPTGHIPTDFTDGAVKAIYRLEQNGEIKLHTLYPNPKQ